MGLQRLAAIAMLTLLAAAVPAVALTGTAAADPGNGAQHVESEYHDANIDYSSHALFNITENENNLSVISQETASYSYNYDGCSLSQSGGSKTHYLFKSTGTTQVEHLTVSYTFTSQGCGDDQACIINNRYQYANGEVRHEDFNYTCTPV